MADKGLWIKEFKFIHSLLVVLVTVTAHQGYSGLESIPADKLMDVSLRFTRLVNFFWVSHNS